MLKSKLDYKSLAVARIYLAIVIIFLTVNNLIYYNDFFHYKGVFGEATKTYFSSTPTFFGNLYFFEFIGKLTLVVNIFMSILFMVGYRARWFAISYFILNVSIVNFLESHSINSGADNYVVTILFWILLLPYNIHYSTFMNDERDTKSSDRLYYLLLIIMSLMYFLTGITKNGVDWTKDFSSVEYVLGSIYSSGIGNYLFESFGTLQFKMMTVIVLVWEILFPFLILLSLFKVKIRPWLGAGIFLFHLGLAISTTPLWTFFFVFTVNAVLLMPDKFWDIIKVDLVLSHLGKKYIVGVLPNQHSMTIRYSMATIGLAISIYTSILTISKSKGNQHLQQIAALISQNQRWNLFAPETPHFNYWVELIGKEEHKEVYSNVLDGKTRGIFMPKKNYQEYYGSRLHFSFFTYNFHPEEDLRKKEIHEYLVVNTLRRFCKKYSKYEAIELNYMISPISLKRKKHQLDGYVQREHMGTLDCKQMEFSLDKLFDGDDLIKITEQYQT